MQICQVFLQEWKRFAAYKLQSYRLSIDKIQEVQLRKYKLTSQGPYKKFYSIKCEIANSCEFLKLVDDLQICQINKKGQFATLIVNYKKERKHNVIIT